MTEWKKQKKIGFTQEKNCTLSIFFNSLHEELVMTRKEEDLAEKMYADLKEKIIKHYAYETEFHRCFYREKIDPDADKATLQRYVDRAMKDKHKKPEMVAGWICFMEQEIEKRYGKSLTSGDGKAAWKFRLQVKSRITGEPGRPIGTSRAALDSTYELFNAYRQISGEYGPDCTVFDELAGLYVDGPLRQFNTIPK